MDSLTGSQTTKCMSILDCSSNVRLWLQFIFASITNLMQAVFQCAQWPFMPCYIFLVVLRHSAQFGATGHSQWNITVGSYSLQFRVEGTLMLWLTNMWWKMLNSSRLRLYTIFIKSSHSRNHEAPSQVPSTWSIVSNFGQKTYFQLPTFYLHSHATLPFCWPVIELYHIHFCCTHHVVHNWQTCS